MTRLCVLIPGWDLCEEMLDELFVPKPAKARVGHHFFYMTSNIDSNITFNMILALLICPDRFRTVHELCKFLRPCFPLCLRLSDRFTNYVNFLPLP